MQNPSELYRVEAQSAAPGARPGPLLVLLGAFLDAGNIQRQLVGHLVEAGSAETVATFDVDQLLDYRGRRPMMVFERNGWLSYDAPSMTVVRLTDRDGQPYYVLSGPEPDYQWERMIEAIRSLSAQLGVTTTVTTHGIPMGVPHTRPVGMTAHATDPALVGNVESPFGTVQVPGGFASVLEYRLGQHGAPAVGFAIHVPHYLAQSEWAEGALAALNAIVDATGLNLPNDALVTRAGENQAEIAREVADNAEAGAIVAALEQQYDSFAKGQERPSLLATDTADLPSADQLGAEFEAFLRNVADEGTVPGEGTATDEGAASGEGID